jgi:hypothetical protein
MIRATSFGLDGTLVQKNVVGRSRREVAGVLMVRFDAEQNR